MSVNGATQNCYASQKSRGIGCENGELKSGVINVPREESEKAFCSQKAIQANEGGAKGQSRGKRNKCRRPRVARYAGLPLDGTAAPRATPVGNSIFPALNVRNPRDDNPVKSATRYTKTRRLTRRKRFKGFCTPVSYTLLRSSHPKHISRAPPIHISKSAIAALTLLLAPFRNLPGD